MCMREREGGWVSLVGLGVVLFKFYFVEDIVC